MQEFVDSLLSAPSLAATAFVPPSICSSVVPVVQRMDSHHSASQTCKKCIKNPQRVPPGSVGLQWVCSSTDVPRAKLSCAIRSFCNRLQHSIATRLDTSWIILIQLIQKRMKPAKRWLSSRQDPPSVQCQAKSLTPASRKALQCATALTKEQDVFQAEENIPNKSKQCVSRLEAQFQIAKGHRARRILLMYLNMRF